MEPVAPAPVAPVNPHASLVSHVTELKTKLSAGHPLTPQPFIDFLDKILHLLGVVAPVVEAVDPALAPALTTVQGVGAAAEGVAKEIGAVL